MAQAAAFNPDGSPNAALNSYRRRAIVARKDKGQMTRNFNLYEFSCHDGSYVPQRAPRRNRPALPRRTSSP